MRIFYAVYLLHLIYARYHAAEALYNIAKVAQGGFIAYFNEAFDAMFRYKCVYSPGGHRQGASDPCLKRAGFPGPRIARSSRRGHLLNRGCACLLWCFC